MQGQTATSSFFTFFHMDFLSSKWIQKNKKTVLTPRLIFDGIMKEVENQKREECRQDPDLTEDDIKEAISNAQDSWE